MIWPFTALRDCRAANAILRARVEDLSRRLSQANGRRYDAINEAVALRQQIARMQPANSNAGLADETDPRGDAS